MKELKVGERVTITLEVVEQSSCTGCFFCGQVLVRIKEILVIAPQDSEKIINL